MKINLKQKVQSSLFLKILLLFALASVTIITAAISTDEILSRRDHHPQLRKNKVQYSRYLMNDLGTPPDTSLARTLSDSLGIKIRFESENFKWASDPGMISFDNLHLREYYNDKNIYTGWQEGVGLCVDITQSQGRYLFVLKSERDDFTYAFALHTGIIIVVVILVIVGIYFAIRWLLQPVKDLNEGVQQLAKGNLDYEVPCNRKDELGELVSSFNSMTNRVKEMIHAREQLLLDVSHELRSPLTRTKVALEFLENGKVKKEISDDIGEMEGMVTEILESQRLNSSYGGVNCKRTNLAGLLKSVCEEFRKQKPGLKLSSFPDSVFLDLDPERTRILFKNVISNAFRYSGADSSPVEVSLLQNNGEVVVSVKDFGAGIPKQDLPYIFEPFYRVDKSRSKNTGGYGLGLSLSKKIMEAHGGDIKISSTLKKGTTVQLKFKR